MTSKEGKKGDPSVPSHSYNPTDWEQGQVRAYFDERATSKWPRLKVETKQGSESVVEIDHPDQQVGVILLARSLGTNNGPFLEGLIADLENIACPGKNLDERSLNRALSIVQGIGPKDEVEALLATQMAAIHSATVSTARSLKHADMLPQFDSYERALNKLARTFTSQVEALKRYRTGGQQKVTVEHVTVNEGGQAIVGNVKTRGRGKK